MRAPLVYVAGPYTHPDPVINTHDAIKVGEEIESNLGFNVFIPHLSLLWCIVSPAPLHRWYERDNAVLLRCDAVFRMAGESPGADAEVALAEQHDIPVFTSMTDMRDWWLP